jgi:hypothetical protein
MSRTTHSSTLRPLAVAGFLAAAALAAPTASHAQSSSEIALMNRLAPTVFVPNALALGSAAAFPVPNDAVSGEVALLVRTPIIHPQNPEAGAVETAPVSVNGSYALLGSRSPLDPRREAVPAASR